MWSPVPVLPIRDQGKQRERQHKPVASGVPNKKDGCGTRDTVWHVEQCIEQQGETQ